MDVNDKFCIWWRAFGNTAWTRIDDYLVDKPDFRLGETSTLETFNLTFNDLALDDLLNLQCGDDIAITTDSNCSSILQDKFAGCISRIEIDFKPIGVDEDGISEKILTYSCSIEQRDFSTQPFQLTELDVLNLSDFLGTIFLNYTRSDLGGKMPVSGLIVPKYLLLSDDIEIENVDLFASVKTMLSDVLNRIGYSWDIVYFSEASVYNGITLIQQVRIWAD